MLKMPSPPLPNPKIGWVEWGSEVGSNIPLPVRKGVGISDQPTWGSKGICSLINNICHCIWAFERGGGVRYVYNFMFDIRQPQEMLHNPPNFRC